MTTLLLQRAATAPGRTLDLAIRDGRLVAPEEVGAGAEVVDLEGRPVIAGLADHHVHLHALAAARSSVDLSPSAVDAAGGLVPALRRARRASPTGWLRGVGYDVATTGRIDRHVLDAAAVGPVRVQDRTGTWWVLSSDALDAVLPADRRDHPRGVERDPSGALTGVMVRLDHWLRPRVPAPSLDLPALGRELAARGVTAVTDAGATNDETTLAALASARLPLRTMAMTGAPDTVAHPAIALGPVKVLLDDADLPPLGDLTARVAAAHGAGRRVAVHCVSAVQAVLALSAGLRPGDRIEHASEVPPDLEALVVASGVTLVVQPGLVHGRGDRYLVENAARDLPSLHRLGTLDALGVPLAAGSDAPYGDPDPWLGIAAAVHRLTAAGVPFGPREAVTARRALALHQGHLHDPSRPRPLRPGAPADLVVLDDDWSALAHRPQVAATFVAGRPTHGHL